MADERVTPSFWLSEFLRSDIATRKGLDNTPNAAQYANLRAILVPGMQCVRELLGGPIIITSGFRSRAVNEAVGGSPSSQHILGLAADFVCPRFGGPRSVALHIMRHAAQLRFDQLIWEKDWVHISFVASRPREEVLTAHFGDKGVTYTSGINERRFT